MVVYHMLDLQLPTCMQSVPITSNVVSSNPARGEVYSIQHYVKKCAARLWFSPVSSTNKTDRHDITEILLEVALNIITLTHDKDAFLFFILLLYNLSLIPTYMYIYMYVHNIHVGNSQHNLIQSHTNAPLEL